MEWESYFQTSDSFTCNANLIDSKVSPKLMNFVYPRSPVLLEKPPPLEHPMPFEVKKSKKHFSFLLLTVHQAIMKSKDVPSIDDR
jgi:hypothetical protein